MKYCLNPDCPKPKNPPDAEICNACGSKLLLHNRYRVITILGKGGFGATFLAIDIILPGKPRCVVKQLRPSTNTPSVLHMARVLFKREAETLGKVDHPQVPRLLDYFEDNQQFYLVQEYIKGHNLEKEVKQNGPFSEAGVKQFLSEMLPILKDIHSHKMIHRDIKPANLIRREQDKRLVLIDFGAVKDQVNTVAASNTYAQTAFTNFAVGTFGFAPPEQMAMRPIYASDIYALGVTCIYLLTGKSPKDLGCDPSTGEISWQKYVNISEPFAEVLQTMVEMSTRHRYQSADQVLNALDLQPYSQSLAESLHTKRAPGDKPTDNLPSSESLKSPKLQLYKPPIKNKSRNIPVGSDRRNQQMSGNLHKSGYIGSGSISSRNVRTNIPVSGKLSGRKKVRTKLDATDIINEYSKGNKDFAQQNLNYLNFKKANLSGVNFHQSQMIKVDLQGANLSKADFGSANLSQALLQNANLSGAYLSNTNLEDADLRGADLKSAYLNNANLKRANLSGADLTDAKVSKEQLAQAKKNWRTIMPSGKAGFW
ncbi:MAG: pentapeptide repeat-containing protein [Xenococcaceae cyanobacterium]